jgi:hypothetical protein
LFWNENRGVLEDLIKVKLLIKSMESSILIPQIKNRRWLYYQNNISDQPYQYPVNRLPKEVVKKWTN